MKTESEIIAIYEAALQKIVELGIQPMSETELDRIKRLKSIAHKALFICAPLPESPNEYNTEQ